MTEVSKEIKTSDASSIKPEELFSMLQEPIKPSNDDREYKCIQLLSNGMKVVLVRDPKEEKSAASLSLPVGHCSDPDYAPGLAHFLEHLLFLGTTKYPKEGEYVAHIKANGGTYNAYTSGLETVYYFDILSGVMEPTLDRFAQFFIAPLFDESCVERELSAVDSEHAKNVQTDSRRFYQLSKSLADAKHPFSKFGTGNRETLKTTSEAKGIKIRDEVIKFYKSFYSANLMTLAIVSNQSFETMQEWVVSKFSAVPTNKDAKVPSFADFDHPFAGNIGELRHIVPVRDDRFLRMKFPMSSFYPVYQSKPHRVVGDVLARTGPGTLSSVLKKRGWINSVRSAGASHNSPDFAEFIIAFDLTPEGQDKWHEVMAVTFDFVNILSKMDRDKWECTYREISQLCEQSFNWKSKPQAVDLVQCLATAMARFPSQEILSAPYIFRPTFDMREIREVLFGLRTDNMYVEIVSKSLPKSIESKLQTEQWCRAQYAVEKLAPQQIALLALPSGLSESKGLRQPSPNAFLTTDFDVLYKTARQSQVAAALKTSIRGDSKSSTVTTASDDSCTSCTCRATEESKESKETETPIDLDADSVLKQDQPLLVPLEFFPDGQESPRFIAWFAPDMSFQQPKSQLLVRILSSVAGESVSSKVMMGLLKDYLKDLLLELTADASDALLGHTISSSSLGLDVAVAGFSQKLPRLLLLILEQLMLFASSKGTVDDEARFELVKNLRIRNLNNMSTRQPCELSHDDVHAILLSSALDLGTNIALVKQVRLADLRLFAKRFLGGEVLERLQKQQSDQVSVSLWEKLSPLLHPLPSIELVMFGNETHARALSIANLVHRMLRSPPSGEEKKELHATFDALEGKSVIDEVVKVSFTISPDIVAKTSIEWVTKCLEEYTLKVRFGLESPRDPKLVITVEGKQSRVEAARSFPWITAVRRLNAAHAVETDAAADKRVKAFYKNLPHSRCTILSAENEYVHAHVSTNPVEKNVAIRLYFQIGADTARNRALCRLFETIVYAPLFSELRTKQELGYIVGCSTTRTAGVIGFMVSVQAKAGFTPELLKERADTFLNSFTSSSETLLAAMGRQVPCTVGYDGNLFVTDVSFGIFSEAENQEFVKVRKSVIEKLLVAPKKQSELFERWTSQLAFHRLRFKDIAEEVNALEELTLDDLATFYTDYIHQKGTKCAKLCVKVPPYPTKEVEHEVQHKTAPATSEVKGDSKALLVPALASKKTEGDFETLSVATATREERQVMSKVTAMMSSRFFVGTAARPIVVIGGDIAEWRQQQMVHPQYAHFM